MPREASLRMQVLAPSDVLTQWIAEGGGQPSLEVLQHGGRLRLFSTNDYLGLSTHSHVRRAAAHAAMLYGMGEATRHSFVESVFASASQA
jgi:7-keto-8-aminopelargonate synthetase-like enzyme